MSGRFIDDFAVILLDVCNTFMFDADRFGDAEDYHTTYRQIGGRSLGAREIRTCINGILNRMNGASHDPERYDDFGDIRRFLGAEIAELPHSERERIVEVFARHEVGRIPEIYAEAIRQLARSHLLGLLSNIWSPSYNFEVELDRVGLRDHFTVRIWSSDHGSIKPSSRLFQMAVDAFDIDPARVLYVGDSPQRDIAGAKAVGMAAAWIENEIRPLTAEVPSPDLIISDVTQLLHVCRQEKIAE